MRRTTLLLVAFAMFVTTAGALRAQAHPDLTGRWVNTLSPGDAIKIALQGTALIVTREPNAILRYWLEPEHQTGRLPKAIDNVVTMSDGSPMPAVTTAMWDGATLELRTILHEPNDRPVTVERLSLTASGNLVIETTTHIVVKSQRVYRKAS
jgi:hypothetical protein